MTDDGIAYLSIAQLVKRPHQPLGSGVIAQPRKHGSTAFVGGNDREVYVIRHLVEVEQPLQLVPLEVEQRKVAGAAEHVRNLVEANHIVVDRGEVLAQQDLVVP